MSQNGFTLVELLVVISIIAILSVIGITIFAGAQKSARNSKRISDMKAISLALDLYYYDPVNNNTYPPSSERWRSECPEWGGYAADSVIPGLVPNYMVAFPSDPGMNKNGNTSCYLYISFNNGVDYALLDHDIGELQGSRSDYFSYRPFVDPTRDGGSDGCQVDGTSPWSWKISSPGGRCL